MDSIALWSGWTPFWQEVVNCSGLPGEQPGLLLVQQFLSPPISLELDHQDVESSSDSRPVPYMMSTHVHSTCKLTLVYSVLEMLGFILTQ